MWAQILSVVAILISLGSAAIAALSYRASQRVTREGHQKAVDQYLMILCRASAYSAPNDVLTSWKIGKLHQRLYDVISRLGEVRHDLPIEVATIAVHLDGRSQALLKQLRDRSNDTPEGWNLLCGNDVTTRDAYENWRSEVQSSVDRLIPQASAPISDLTAAPAGAPPDDIN